VSFDIDEFVAGCRAAMSETQPVVAVREVMDRALTDRAAICDVLHPDRARIEPLLSTPTLTVMNVVWAPGMSVPPHEHRMWACIGVYAGQEDNAFWRRVSGGLAASGGRDLRAGDALLMGDDAVHSVHNPLATYTGGIHVYGGDFLHEPRSEWDPVTFEERPQDFEARRREFEEAERVNSGPPSERIPNGIEKAERLSSEGAPTASSG
jgi:predicted metal-dependent enzyme (double-stranded beta helix superfamily)